MSAAVASSAPVQPAPTATHDLARDMLLGQHSVTFTAEHTGLPAARVTEMARKLHGAKRIPKVRP